MDYQNNLVIKTFDYNSTIDYLMFDILLSRGILVEFDGSLISYQGNIADLLFVNELLSRSDLGKFDESNLLLRPKPPISPDKVALLFEPFHVSFELYAPSYASGEGGYMRYEEGWNYFKCAIDIDSSMALENAKVSLVILETHIALLVNALASVGCRTYSSCEGGDDPAHIGFVGPYHSRWGIMIIEETIANLQLEENWKFDGDMLTVEPNNSWAQVWKELILVGKSIYFNKMYFLEKKQEIIDDPKRFDFSVPENELHYEKKVGKLVGRTLTETHLHELIKSLPISQRFERWMQATVIERINSLEYMEDPEIKKMLIESLSAEELKQLLSEMDMIQLEFIEEKYFPESALKEVTSDTDTILGRHYNLSEHFTEHRVATYTDQNVLILPETATVKEARCAIQHNRPDYTNAVLLIKPDNTYAGRVFYSEISFASSLTSLHNIANHDSVAISCDSYLTEAAEKMKLYNSVSLPSLPVVDKDKKLLGHIVFPWIILRQPPEVYERCEVEEMQIFVEAQMTVIHEKANNEYYIRHLWRYDSYLTEKESSLFEDAIEKENFRDALDILQKKLQHMEWSCEGIYKYDLYKDIGYVFYMLKDYENAFFHYTKKISDMS